MSPDLAAALTLAAGLCITLLAATLRVLTVSRRVRHEVDRVLFLPQIEVARPVFADRHEVESAMVEGLGGTDEAREWDDSIDAWMRPAQNTIDDIEQLWQDRA